MHNNKLAIASYYTSTIVYTSNCILYSTWLSYRAIDYIRVITKN